MTKTGLGCNVTAQMKINMYMCLSIFSQRSLPRFKVFNCSRCYRIIIVINVLGIYCRYFRNEMR